MAVTIMAGLTFGTMLTMVVVPVLYCILFRLESPETGVRVENKSFPKRPEEG
jgi:hypothetical protein